MKKVVLFFITAVFAAASSAYAIETRARQAFLIDMETQSVLYAKDADVPMHPSSMSKLMTIYLLFQRMQEGRVKLEDTFTVSEKAWRMQGSKTFVPIGGELTVEQLIHGIITQSGNDACIVVAEGLSGTEDEFARQMNRVAKEIGLTNSHFVNSTGMPEDEHLMSARDLAVLAERLIADFPEYYPYFDVREYTFNNIRQHNRNRLLGSGGVDGLKTGHTEVAGYGIVLSAKQGDRRLILVINGMANDKERVEEGDKLLRYGFREFENRQLISKGQAVSDAQVWFGAQPNVPLVADEDVLLTLPVNAAKTMTMAVSYQGPLQAPVEAGAHVADLRIETPGGEPRMVKLLAGQPVEKLSGFRRMVAVARHYLSGQP